MRTLRNGKRRYINQFESDIMSDLEFDICNNPTNSTNPTPPNTITTSNIIKTSTSTTPTPLTTPTPTPTSSQNQAITPSPTPIHNSQSELISVNSCNKQKSDSTSSCSSSVNEEEFDTTITSTPSNLTNGKSGSGSSKTNNINLNGSFSSSKKSKSNTDAKSTSSSCSSSSSSSSTSSSSSNGVRASKKSKKSIEVTSNSFSSSSCNAPVVSPTSSTILSIETLDNPLVNNNHDTIQQNESPSQQLPSKIQIETPLSSLNQSENLLSNKNRSTPPLLPAPPPLQTASSPTPLDTINMQPISNNNFSNSQTDFKQDQCTTVVKNYHSPNSNSNNMSDNIIKTFNTESNINNSTLDEKRLNEENLT